MDYQLKRLSPAGIPAALSKARHYRALNEPDEAESILRDVLATEPDNEEARRLLGLALTDQFPLEVGFTLRFREARTLFEGLADAYQRAYYLGILHEREAKASLRHGQPARTVVPTIEKALACFEQAEQLAPEGDESARLRFNRCVRLLETQRQAGWLDERTVWALE